MFNRPKFTFAILTWNRKAFLVQCVNSLVENLGPADDSEILLTDNGSTDGTWQFIETFRNDPRFKISRIEQNAGLNAYKSLIAKASGKYVVVIDDDVLLFPADMKGIFERYLNGFPDFGFLSLDVVQNEHTNGAKPEETHYVDIHRGGLTMQLGPAGAWCACFRRRDFRRMRFFFNRKHLSMRASHDSHLTGLFAKWLRLKSGIIKGHRCFHACGPYYAKQHGFLDREIEKYNIDGMDAFVKAYSEFK